MFIFGRGYRRIGPLGIAFAGYRAWRRLSPTQRQQIKQRARTLTGHLRSATTRPQAWEGKPGERYGGSQISSHDQGQPRRPAPWSQDQWDNEVRNQHTDSNATAAQQKEQEMLESGSETPG
jgi:hypothetical protein